MRLRHLWRLAPPILTTLALATPAAAEPQTFAVLLSDRTLGTLSYDPDGPTLTAVLDNTPLGVGDGRFEGTSRPVRLATGELVTQYIGRSDDRTISVLLDAGRATQTDVSPANEATELSDIGRVPPGVVDPVAGFGQVAQAAGCPGPVRIYDGRRVTDLRTTGSTLSEGVLTCQVDYAVVAGPGHLSPFRFTSIAMVLDYATGGDAGLRRITLTAGLFTVVLDRR